MDFLDEQDLSLSILSSLAVNLATSPSTEDDRQVILEGLPSDAGEEYETWTQESTTHILSYTHYLLALPLSSPFLPAALPRLRGLLRGIWEGGRVGGEEGEGSSGGRVGDLAGVSTLASALLKALSHLAHSTPTAEGQDTEGGNRVVEEVVGVLVEFVEKIARGLGSSGHGVLCHSLLLLSSLHSHILTHPLLPLPSPNVSLLPFLTALSLLPTPTNITNLTPDNWDPSSLSSSLALSTTSDHAGGIRVESPSTHGRGGVDEVASYIRSWGGGARLVLMVLDIEGVLLASLLAPVSPAVGEEEEEYRASLLSWTPLLTQPAPAARLAATEVLDGWKREAEGWWEDLLPGGSGIGGTEVGGEGIVVALLKLLTLISIHKNQLDTPHMERLKTLLTERAGGEGAGGEKGVEMGVGCLGVLVLNFPELASSTLPQIRKFATSQLPNIEADTLNTSSSACDSQSLMHAIARCLAVCIQVAKKGTDDLGKNMVFSILNSMSHDGGRGAATVKSMGVSFAMIGMGGRESADASGDEEKRIGDKQRLAANAIAMATRVALEIKDQETIHYLVGLFLQRLRTADAYTAAAFVTNLVPLGLKSKDEIVIEITRSLSLMSRSASPEDPRYTSNAVLSAQTSLARGLGSRPEACQAYLAELLSLFADKGSQIQVTHSGVSGSKEKEKDISSRVSDMTSQLAALILPIDAVLAHSSFEPSVNPTPECVAAFRNMWFLIAMFGFTGAKSSFVGESGKQALLRIARKTPALVMEDDKDYVTSGLEYNVIFRKDYASSVISKQRSILSEYLPKCSSDIRSFSLPQVIFLMAIHDLELTRTRQDKPSVILQYFSNASINESGMLPCLEAIAEKVKRACLSRMSTQVVNHSLPTGMLEEVRKMLVATTHRFSKVRQAALKYLDSILTSFAALMCDKRIVFALLETMTLLRRSCEEEFTDEYSPVYIYRSDKIDLSLELPDNFIVRNEIIQQLHSYAKKWLSLAIARAPIEMQSILQTYLMESRDVLLLDNVEMGAGLAMYFAKSISQLDRQETLMPNIGGWSSDSSNLLASQFASKQFFNGEISGARLVMGKGLDDVSSRAPATSSRDEIASFRQQMATAYQESLKGKFLAVSALRRLLLRAVSVLVHMPTVDRDILHYLVSLPIRSFTALGVAAGVDAWSWLVAERPDLEIALLAEVSDGWLWTIKAKKGLFSGAMDSIGPFEHPIEYSPTDKGVMDHALAAATRLLRPHLLLIQVISSRYQAVKYREPGIMLAMIRLLMRSFKSYKSMSTHPLAREVRFSLVLFGFQVLSSCKLESLLELRFRDNLYLATMSWFAVRPMWSYGSNRIQVGAEMRLLDEVSKALQNDQIRSDHSVTSMTDRSPAWLIPGYTSLRDYVLQHRDRANLLQLLIENEISRLAVWSNPANEAGRKTSPPAANLESTIAADAWPVLIRRAWKISPGAAVHMGERFKLSIVQTEISRLVKAHPKAVIDVPGALHFLLGDRLEPSARAGLQWLPLWAPVPPVTAVVYFQPRYDNNPLILQYAMRALEQYPVELTFFFVPQVVQALRADGLGYVERFIFETSKISQLFCHQIIWNMKANCYKDDSGEVEDPMKPVLDRMVDNVVAALSGEAKAFYDKEFGFFNEVTSISGKLKPFIKKTKPEKKAKIDEWMAQIDVSVGVYLPSNPDGVVIELDKKSGRPLQSHAKAPFMATFKVRKERIEYDSAVGLASDVVELEDTGRKVNYDVWQAAIFKVGDDCRQDVLALQLIAMFKNIFMKAGLVLYLFPYRVTATAPGCGVIDVVPNATSRDEMGRAKINDLNSYFVDKYGSVDSIPFQKARLNFIQSMAAYSVACYILQIKDRHNGNIMIDGDGHIVHIDFGFLFDIGPGGVKFEPNSFKLNHEMVVLMGGRASQGYRMFTELTIKAFLAIRPFADQLVDTVHLMLGTGLPSFKGEATIKRLRDRFALHLGEREAAEYMKGVIKDAHENYRSTVYDGFQKAQNGIPY